MISITFSEPSVHVVRKYLKYKRFLKFSFHSNIPPFDQPMKHNPFHFLAHAKQAVHEVAHDVHREGKRRIQFFNVI